MNASRLNQNLRFIVVTWAQSLPPQNHPGFGQMVALSWPNFRLAPNQKILQRLETRKAPCPTKTPGVRQGTTAKVRARPQLLGNNFWEPWIFVNRCTRYPIKIFFYNVHPRTDSRGALLEEKAKNYPIFLLLLCIGGSVVEFSPATREARVWFPANTERALPSSLATSQNSSSCEGTNIPLCHAPEANTLTNLQWHSWQSNH